jgi:hypothetical protein
LRERFLFVSANISLDSQKAALANIQVGIPSLPHAGSVTHIEVLKEWIHCCNENHHCYPRSNSFVPTRLLDVSSSDSGTIKLLDNGRGHTGWTQYIALSHRWGSPKQYAFRTLKTNIENFKKGIDVAKLPQTFQDAIHISHALGFKLWIDSLCIIQDDKDDWAAESKLMEHVFSSAYCTIAASCATGGSDGFLKPRPQRQCINMQGPGEDAMYYVCEKIDDFHIDVEKSELNQRGWVLQERALSRRTIYFTEAQSYWECGEGVQCETMNRMKK